MSGSMLQLIEEENEFFCIQNPKEQLQDKETNALLNVSIVCDFLKF